MHVQTNAIEPMNQTTFFSFISAVHVMSATTTTTKAALVSTQAASTVQSCRVATAVGLLDLNARLLGSWDSMRLGRLIRLEQRHGVPPTVFFSVVISGLLTLPGVRSDDERAS